VIKRVTCYLKTIFKYIFFKIEFRNIKIHISNKIGRSSFFEGYNKLGERTIFSGYIGIGSYIGPNSNINAKIGRYCSIAENVNITTGTHPTTKIVSTSPSFYSPSKIQNGLSFTDEYI
jgi:acetyltransferase-like isoleucine patch superfamily enzyme